MWKQWKECPVAVTAENCDFTNTAMSFLSDGTFRDLEIFFMTAWPIWFNRNQMVILSTSLETRYGVLPLELSMTAKKPLFTFS